MATRRWFVLLVCLFLAGCGGGGSGSAAAPSAPSAPAPVRDAPPLLLYFGVAAKQLEETADHVDCLYAMDWGDWDTMAGDIADRIIAQLVEAKQRGFKSAIVAVGFTMFSKAYAYEGTANLAAFLKRVQAVGIPIVGVSIIDEPDMAGVSDAVMTKAIVDAKKVTGVKVFVVYGDHGQPGAAAADVVGRDAYPSLVTIPVRPGQQQWLFAGGSDPWRVDPVAAGFVAYAQAHPEVCAICAFTWLDGWGGTTNKGVRSNGMAPAYRAAAAALKKIA